MRLFFSKSILVVLLLFASCADEAPVLTIPYAPVNFKIDVLTDKIGLFDHALFEKPRREGEYTGFAGLLIFRNQEGVVFAYDLCCPNEKSREIKVMPNDKGEAVCPVCGSIYDIWTGLGNLKSGVSAFPLQRYHVQSATSSGVFYIRN